MATSGSTLAGLWVDDGNSSPVKMSNSLPQATVVHTHNGNEIKDDALNFYRGTGLEPVAREAGILDSKGQIPMTVTHATPSYDIIQVAPIASSAQQMTSNTPQTQYIRQVAVKTEPGGVVRHVSLPPGATAIRAIKTEGGVTPTIRAIKTEGGAPARIVGQVVRQLVTSPQTIAPKPSTPTFIQASPQIIPKRNTAHLVATPTPLDFGSPSSSSSWQQAHKRPLEASYDIVEPVKRKKEKGGKGLRHFSMKVCEKVQRKGVTSYNEVADELVAEFSDNRSLTATELQYDQKNIRRRVYDALNVLMAMNIISKEKKEIRWIGLPTNSAQECQNLEFEKRLRLERVRHKTQQLQELILQQIAFKQLVERNRELERRQGPPSANSAIQLPFIIVNTSKKTVIDCSISNDKYEYLFNFDNTFEIHDDIEVLKRMGMAFGLEKNQCSVPDLQRAVRMVPKALEPYVLQLAKVRTVNSNSTLGGASLLSGAGPSNSPSLAATSANDSLNGSDIEVANVTNTLLMHDSDDDSSDRSSPIDV